MIQGKVKKLKQPIIFLLSILFAGSFICFAQEDSSSQGILLIREGKQLKKTTVAVEGYLYNDILQVQVEVRMYAERPKIVDVVFTGPKLGRIHYNTRQDLPITLKEEDPYNITRVDGMISFGKRTRVKKPKGTLTKELFRIKLPVDKIISGKLYQLWVEVESKRRGGRIPKFKFDLKKLPELVLKSQ